MGLTGLHVNHLRPKTPHRNRYPTTRFSVSRLQPTAPSTAATWPKEPRKRPSRKPLLPTVRFKKFVSSKTRDTHSSDLHPKSQQPKLSFRFTTPMSTGRMSSALGARSPANL